MNVVLDARRILQCQAMPSGSLCGNLETAECQTGCVVSRHGVCAVAGVTGDPSSVPQQQQPLPPQAPQQQQQQQQQAPLLVPGQTMLSAQQPVAANQMVPGGLPLVPAMIPTHQVALPLGLPQSTPLLVSVPAATQPLQLVPSQGIVHVAPVAGLTPLAHVPTQVGSTAD